MLTRNVVKSINLCINLVVIFILEINLYIFLLFNLIINKSKLIFIF